MTAKMGKITIPYLIFLQYLHSYHRTSLSISHSMVMVLEVVAAIAGDDVEFGMSIRPYYSWK